MIEGMDIVARLRRIDEMPVCDEAADEIERLRAALSPFARHAHCVNEIQQSSLALWCAQALNALSGDEIVNQQQPNAEG